MSNTGRCLRGTLRVEVAALFRSEPSWYGLTDALPQHEAWPPGFTP